MKVLLQTWSKLCASRSTDHEYIASCWQEIQKAYQSKGRYYHNLQHLSNLLLQAQACYDQLKDYELLCFSIFYHDIIYSSLRKDNEPKSAALAKKRLQKIGLSNDRIEKCCQQIKATQKHQIPPHSTDPDLPYFLDFDLSILGSNWSTYQTYTEQIRKEYRIYPGWMYRKGRKQVLSHFLERERLFFTDTYFQQYEIKARTNLQRELENLGRV
jgi:predicted metal-dependent HD superfamily phosphohydrolase